MNARAGAASRPTILLAVLAAIALSMLYLIRPVAATQPHPNHKVTICHRTASETNPYVRITVDEASVDGSNGNDNRKGDHLLEHTGPVWPARAGNPAKWGDIIPPFYSDGTPDGHPSLNWNAAGMAIFFNSCNFAGEKESHVAIVKVNNQPNPVLPGTVVSYTLTVTVSDGPANGVVVTDVLPLGLDAPTSISNGGSYASATRTITWNLGPLANGSHVLTYQAAVSAGTSQVATLTNLAVVTSPNSQCPNAANIAPECDDDSTVIVRVSTVIVRVPTLVIDKAASTEVVHLPASVTWTLTYTLTNGPVTNVVITDPLSGFLNFVSASNSGTFADGVITWNLGTLTTSGSLSFVTNVAPNAPQPGPILNVATIDSTETAPDTGQDSITVTSQQIAAATGIATPKPVQAVAATTGTPAGTLPNAALSQSGTSPIPTIGFALILLASLLMLARANVKRKVTTVRNRS